MVVSNNVIFRVQSESEQKFYELLMTKSEISLKEVCRKIPRKMAYKYIHDLFEIQKKLGMEIINKKAGICNITSMPIVIFERKTELSIERLADFSLVSFNQF